MLDLSDEQNAQPFRVTAGFIAFVTLLFLPVILALVIYLGAWAVSSEVRAAEASEGTRAGFNTVSEDQVAGWKKTLVGVCPLH
jgi:hypothetical protein